VHLRVPGQEHKEDLETGTRAAAAGGFCAVVAMPNTDPVVDSAPILRALRDAAARDARVPVAFTGLDHQGPARRGAHRDGRAARRGRHRLHRRRQAVVSAGMMRKALQYQRLAGGLLAPARGGPALSGRGAMHEGEVSALLGIAGIPSVSESTMVARDCALAATKAGASTSSTCRASSRCRRSRRPRRPACT
jgi:dihydroorotase